MAVLTFSLLYLRGVFMLVFKLRKIIHHLIHSYFATCMYSFISFLFPLPPYVSTTICFVLRRNGLSPSSDVWISSLGYRNAFAFLHLICKSFLNICLNAHWIQAINNIWFGAWLLWSCECMFFPKPLPNREESLRDISHYPFPWPPDSWTLTPSHPVYFIYKHIA